MQITAYNAHLGLLRSEPRNALEAATVYSNRSRPTSLSHQVKTLVAHSLPVFKSMKSVRKHSGGRERDLPACSGSRFVQECFFCACSRPFLQSRLRFCLQPRTSKKRPMEPPLAQPRSSSWINKGGAHAQSTTACALRLEVSGAPEMVQTGPSCVRIFPEQREGQPCPQREDSGLRIRGHSLFVEHL